MEDEKRTKKELLEELSILRREMAELKRSDSERKQAEEATQKAMSLLTSTIDSTADGILVVDNEGRIATFNKKFLSMWRIPESLTAQRDDKVLLASVLSQLKDPEGFLEKVMQLYSQPEAESFDILEFTGGRVFERFSQPQRLGNDITGRVWSFRDVTDQRRVEEEQRRNRETAERLAEEMAVIAEIGRVIASTLDIGEVYERFAAETRKLIPFDSLAINLLNLREKRIYPAYVSGSVIVGRRQGDSMAMTGTLSEAVMRTRTGLLIQPASIDEIVGRFPGLSPTFQAGMRSLINVPLISRDEVIGTLHFRAKKPNAYTEQDLRLAERIGTQIAGAIANAQLFTGLKKTETSLRESEARFRVIFEQAAAGVAEIDIATSRFLTVNRRLCEMVGMTEDEMLATTFQAITHPDDLHRHEDKTALLMAEKIERYDLEKRYIRKDGATIWVNLTTSPLWKPGEMPARILTVVQDITDNKRLQEENERRSKQLAALHETSLELMAELNLNTLLRSVVQRALTLIGGDHCNCFLYKPELNLIERVVDAGLSLSLGNTTRRYDEGFVGKIWATGGPLLVNDYHSWQGRKREYDSLPPRALMGVPIRWGDEFLGVLNMAALLPRQFTRADLEVLSLFATQAAIAIRNARLYNQIEQAAVTDELTGLYNRRGFFQLGEREFERASRFGRPLVAGMFDIDHFKRVNDTYGHPAGDQVLYALANCFRQTTRGIDVAGRYGGEEFVLLLPEAFLSGAIQIVERLRQSIAGLSIPICPVNGGSPMVPIHINVSVGVAELLPDVSSLAVLLERADRALYRAKDSGRNRVATWSHQL
jgi:diguanylate cyclase (GGDEF)-like protein/PAS domain S-box-containing protein